MARKLLRNLKYLSENARKLGDFSWFFAGFPAANLALHPHFEALT